MATSLLEKRKYLHPYSWANRQKIRVMKRKSVFEIDYENPKWNKHVFHENLGRPEITNGI